jgi:L-ribulose-5-phosphate 3-epimerase
VTSVLACNLASYGAFQDCAYAHLSEIGIQYVEIPCPEPNKVDRVRDGLAQHGLQASSITIPCQMDADDVVYRFAHYFEAAQALGVQLAFTSAKTAELDREYVYGKLQNIGDEAERRGIVVALETHPDLVTNSKIGLETMAGVAHPNVRINFDTANVYYYNRNVTAEGELAVLSDYVASVHLKDTDGGFESWHFPALGEGVVDFGACIGLLETSGFTGPFTLELEGIQGEAFSETLAKSRVEASLTYLSQIGLIGS